MLPRKSSSFLLLLPLNRGVTHNLITCTSISTCIFISTNHPSEINLPSTTIIEPFIKSLPLPPAVLTIEESRRTQRPYRYGMILLCFGALANWLGLAENYAEPVRYLGVACIIGELSLVRANLSRPATTSSPSPFRVSSPLCVQLEPYSSAPPCAAGCTHPRGRDP